MLELSESDKAKMFDILHEKFAEIGLGTDGKVYVTINGRRYGAGLTWLGAVSEFCRVIQEEADG